MEASISSQQYELLESLLWDGQSLFLEEAHINRLNQAASFFCFPFDKIKIEAKLHQHCSMLPASPHKIRLLVDKSGPSRIFPIFFINALFAYLLLKTFPF